MGTVAFSGAGAPEGSNDAASTLLAPPAPGRWAAGPLGQEAAPIGAAS